METSNLLALGALLLGIQWTGAQGTAINYQGRFLDNGIATTGSYDMQFYLRDAPTGGNPVAPTKTFNGVAPVSVSNGLFRVVLDFGPDVFTGPGRWLEIGVRTNGSAVAYTNLTPRQALLPTPYAIYAAGGATADTTTSATNLIGPLAGNVMGTQGATVVATVGGQTAANVATGANAANLQWLGWPAAA